MTRTETPRDAPRAKACGRRADERQKDAHGEFSKNNQPNATSQDHHQGKAHREGKDPDVRMAPLRHFGEFSSSTTT